ncbi:SPOR domain-containing protein [Sphingomonas sp. SRS2]|uniref:SPOR domain-containing protein n=1 Tax=Sphingomonas sp. SRS2 TaxID=133190 RepID=UPI0006962154|nr:SPOR domain-containing protein [Sphingomonas sp. SRS2]
MKSRWIGVAATALLVAGPAWAASDRPMQSEKRRAAALTASAWAALGKGDAIRAVQDAESAALLQPRDAGTRLLLGRSYLAAGRFTSADVAFRDALTLDPSLTKASISRALAQIALGQEAAARASLAFVEGQAADADIGLALALLGDSEEALTRLTAAARAAGADARTRQNLGLAFALDGRWNDAAAVAAQDVPADMMPQRLRRWATITQMKSDPAMQVGAILGVLPAIDNGQPDALALAAPQSEIPVVLAEAPPTSPPFVMIAAPVVTSQGGSVVTAIAPTPPPLELLTALAAVPASKPVEVTVESSAPIRLAAIEPLVAAWAGPPRMRKSRIIEIAAPRPVAAAQPRAVKSVVAKAPVLAKKPILLASRISVKPSPNRTAGTWAVQLGAFSSEKRTEIAWGRLSGKARFLSAYTPTGSGRRWGKAMLYRLSVSGLPTRAEATSLCVRIKAAGGKCFVRNMSGDRPMTWALRPRNEQPIALALS